jgi:hypothetical protein
MGEAWRVLETIKGTSEEARDPGGEENTDGIEARPLIKGDNAIVYNAPNGSEQGNNSTAKAVVTMDT